MRCVLLEMLKAWAIWEKGPTLQPLSLLRPFYLVLHFTIGLARPLFGWDWLLLLSQVCIGILVTSLDKKLVLPLQISEATKIRFFAFVLLSL